MSIHPKTYYDPLPIPDRRHDWRAIAEDYEPGDPIGYGRTREEAMADLQRRWLEDAGERRTDTLCWRCSRAYDMGLPSCPSCGAANANHDFDDACREMQAETAHGDLIRLQLMRRDLEVMTNRTAEYLRAHREIEAEGERSPAQAAAVLDALAAEKLAAQALEPPSTAGIEVIETAISEIAS